MNSYPNPGQDLDCDLAITLAYQGEEGSKASVIGNLDQQGVSPTDPRDEKRTALTCTVQALLELVDNRGGQLGTTSSLVVLASPLGALVTQAPTNKKMGTSSIN